MKLLDLTGRTIFTLLAIIMLTAAVLWLVKGQTQPAQTAQTEPGVTSTGTSTLTEAPYPTASPTPFTIETPLMPISASPVATQPYPIFLVTPIPGPTYTPTPIQSVNIASFSNNAAGIKVINERQITNGSSDANGSCDFDYYSYISWSPDSRYLLTSRPNSKSMSSKDTTLFFTDMWRYAVTDNHWTMLIPGSGVGLWSPDGTKILYSTPKDMDLVDISVANQNGQDAQLIARTRQGYPIFWLDNNSILYFSDKNQLWDIYTSKNGVAPLELKNLTDNIETFSLDTQAIQFAPNKKWFTYQQGTRLAINSQIDRAKLLTNQLSTDPGIIAWSPDNKRLAYVTATPEGHKYTIWIYNVETASTFQIAEGEQYFDKLAWFPNSQVLLFESYAGGGSFTIRLINADGSSLVNLLSVSPGNPQLSPDGKMMAFFRGCNLWLASLSYSKTETSASTAATVVENKMLPLNQLRPLGSPEKDGPIYALFDAIGWTEKEEVVLQERSLIEQNGAFFPGALYQVRGTWAVSPKDGKVTPLSNWLPAGQIVAEGFMDSVVQGPLWVLHNFNNKGITSLDWATIPTWTPVQQQLAKVWAVKKPITFPQYWYASSDGQTIILRIVSQKIFILKPGQPEPLILPKDRNDVARYESATDAQISPDGKRVVYGVRLDNPESNDGYGRETDTYEIEVSNLDGSHSVVINLAYKFANPGGFTWSADSQFIAFTAQPEEYTDPHIYIAKFDGSDVTDMTPLNFKWATSLYWGPKGLKLLYTGGNPNQPETVGYWVMTLKR